MQKIDLNSLTIEELEQELAPLKMPRFRSSQIYDWLQVKGVSSFDEMNNLSKDMRATLSEKYTISTSTVEKKQVSRYNGVIKYLLRLSDHEYIESVFMEHGYGNTLCVSTQVGCKMECSFCASGLNGFTRNLTAGEILSQIHVAQKDTGKRISHIVLMGMGEPLDNYDNVLRFIHLVTDDKGLNVGMRHITLSTCGVVSGIDKLAHEKLQLTLSVSLHAPTNDLRDKLIPINKKWNIEQLMTACRNYVDKTSRRISFEYALFDGVNDTAKNALQLAGLLKGMLCHVNLIPANPVEEKDHRQSNEKRIEVFQNILIDKHIPVTIRKSLGADIDASCGQLRQNIDNK